MADETDVSPGDDRAEPAPRALPARAPTTALAIRRTCFVHRWDVRRRVCLECGRRIYVEVIIT